MIKKIPSYNRVHELFNYNPETGIFTRKVRMGRMVKGSTVGSIDSCGFIQMNIDNKNYKAHRICFLLYHGYMPKETIIHINSDNTDNRIINLIEKSKIKTTPTQIGLKDTFCYDEKSGEFTWAKGYRKGEVAGTIETTGYRKISFMGKKYLAHRLAWMYVHGYLPEDQIDHINKKRSDNRLCNLREATSQINSINRGLQSNNESGVAGVTFIKRINRYQAYINSCGEKFNIGYFKNMIDATKARYNKEIELNWHKYNEKSSAYLFLKKEGAI